MTKDKEWWRKHFQELVDTSISRIITLKDIRDYLRDEILDAKDELRDAKAGLSGLTREKK